MTENTISKKMNDIMEEEKANFSAQQSLSVDIDRVRLKKANILLQYFKEKPIFSLMTWSYEGETFDKKIKLKAKENWSECPKEMVSFLNPNYHDCFYFLEYEEGIDEVETGVKMGLHFDDGEIFMTLDIEDESDNSKMSNFIKKYGIKIETNDLETKIKKQQIKIEKDKKILEFVKSLNE